MKIFNISFIFKLWLLTTQLFQNKGMYSMPTANNNSLLENSNHTNETSSSEKINQLGCWHAAGFAINAIKEERILFDNFKFNNKTNEMDLKWTIDLSEKDWNNSDTKSKIPIVNQMIKTDLGGIAGEMVYGFYGYDNLWEISNKTKIVKELKELNNNLDSFIKRNSLSNEDLSQLLKLDNTTIKLESLDLPYSISNPVRKAIIESELDSSLTTIENNWLKFKMIVNTCLNFNSLTKKQADTISLFTEKIAQLNENNSTVSRKLTKRNIVVCAHEAGHAINAIEAKYFNFVNLTGIETNRTINNITYSSHGLTFADTNFTENNKTEEEITRFRKEYIRNSAGAMVGHLLYNDLKSPNWKERNSDDNFSNDTFSDELFSIKLGGRGDLKQFEFFINEIIESNKSINSLLEEEDNNAYKNFLNSQFLYAYNFKLLQDNQNITTIFEQQMNNADEIIRNNWLKFKMIVDTCINYGSVNINQTDIISSFINNITEIVENDFVSSDKLTFNSQEEPNEEKIRHFLDENHFLIFLGVILVAVGFVHKYPLQNKKNQLQKNLIAIELQEVEQPLLAKEPNGNEGINQRMLDWEKEISGLPTKTEEEYLQQQVRKLQPSFPIPEAMEMLM